MKLYQALFFGHAPCQKKPGRASKILGNLTARADIGTCKISARSDKRFPQKGPVTTQLELLRLNWIDCILLRKEINQAVKKCTYIMKKALAHLPYERKSQEPAFLKQTFWWLVGWLVVVKPPTPAYRWIFRLV